MSISRRPYLLAPAHRGCWLASLAPSPPTRGACTSAAACALPGGAPCLVDWIGKSVEKGVSAFCLSVCFDIQPARTTTPLATSAAAAHSCGSGARLRVHTC